MRRLPDSINRSTDRLKSILIASALMFSAAAVAEADFRPADKPSWLDQIYLQGGFGTHWSSSEDHEGVPLLVGLEWVRRDQHLLGVSLFNNSFGQFSQYYYYGYQWRLPGLHESAHIKLTGGVIYGYVDEFEDRLDPNFNGWTPAIVPSVGWKQNRLGVDVAILGTAGLMFLVGYDLKAD